MEAFIRSTPLCTSEEEPLRRTTTLSGEPVSTRVFFRPSAIMRMAVKTKTTRAMPEAARIVVRRRVQRLRML